MDSFVRDQLLEIYSPNEVRDIEESRLFYDEIVDLVTLHVDRIHDINQSKTPAKFDPTQETLQYEIEKSDLILLNILSGGSGNPQNFDHVLAFLGLDEDKNTNKLMQTFILVAFDKNNQVLPIGDDGGGNIYLGLERWRPRKTFAETIGNLGQNNRTSVDNYLKTVLK